VTERHDTLSKGQLDKDAAHASARSHSCGARSS
jgi:hypothetical protein